MNLIFVDPHHDGSALYVTPARPVLGQRVTLSMRTPPNVQDIDQVWLRSNIDGEGQYHRATPAGTDDAGWQWWQSSLVATNPRTAYRWLITRSHHKAMWLSQAGTSHLESRDVDDFALVCDNHPPTWIDTAVMYEIFPDRFARSEAADARRLPSWAIPAKWTDPVDPTMPGRARQIYGGDLDGIVNKLDYLQELGVNLIYLTPIFPGQSNHRYDAHTFDEVDPLLGGDDALARLAAEVHRRGMRLIGDLTTNHTGQEHDWFVAARQAHAAGVNAPETEFYYIDDSQHHGYATWMGEKSLPKLNWASGELRERFVSGHEAPVRKWLRSPFELDGWRIDVANMTGRYQDIDLNRSVRTEVRSSMRSEREDTLLLSEYANEAGQDFSGDAWHGAMTYSDFTRPLWAWLTRHDGETTIGADGAEHEYPWFFGQPHHATPEYDGADVVRSYIAFSAGLPWSVRRATMHALDSHDTARFGVFASKEAVGVAFGLAVTLPGIPMLWMGDELGLGGRDGEDSRIPMPWGDLGEEQLCMFDMYKSLIALRRSHPVLSTGSLRWIAAGEDYVMFAREDSSDALVVVATRGPSCAQIPAHLLPGGHFDLLRGDAVLTASADKAWFTAERATLAIWKFAGVQRGFEQR